MLRNASQVRRAFSTCPISLKPSLQSSTSSVNPQFLRKGEGTIASVFATLSGGSLEDALPSRFADLKRSMIRDEAHATAIKSAWTSVLKSLNSELSHIIENGENSIPQVQYPGDEFAKKGLEHWMDSKTLDEIKKRGTVIVKGVVEEAKALKWKEQIRDYVRANPKVKGEFRSVNFFCGSYPDVFSFISFQVSHLTLLKSSRCTGLPPRLRREVSAVHPSSSVATNDFPDSILLNMSAFLSIHRQSRSPSNFPGLLEALPYTISDRIKRFQRQSGSEFSSDFPLQSPQLRRSIENQTSWRLKVCSRLSH